MSTHFFIPKLGEGFAQAMMPIAAHSTLRTDTVGIVAKEVKIPVPDGEIPAYLAIPEEGDQFPIVLVIQEIFGVHEHIKDVCRRLGKAGYMAIAPALYARQGDTANMSNMEEIMKVVAKVSDQQVMSDLDATVAWAAKNKGDVARLTATGFCWGGRIVWLYAAHSTQLKAGAAWYGRLSGAVTENNPKHPLDIAGELRASVIGFYGGKDHGIPQEQVEKMREALRRAGKSCEIHLYPEAGHGFNADYRAGYDPEAARDAWIKMLAWFRLYA